MKNILDGLLKDVLLLIIGGLITFVGQKWVNSDIEYKIASRDSYLSAPLGQQGLTMAFKGKPLKNVSVVDFSIFNRTSKQFADVDLVFSVDKNATSAIVSSDIIPPQGIPKKEFVEKLSPKDPKDRGVIKFRIKILPKQRNNDYFHAVFVFEGDQAPSMSVQGLTGETSLIPYQAWKDFIQGIVIVSVIYVGCMLLLFYRVDFVWWPRIYQKRVEQFVEHVKQHQSDGQTNTDPQFLEDSRKIYASFTKPKPLKFWAKILPEKHFEDKT
ncbi:MAG: hypothetical protein HC852_18840 [Acaryochloridaceae cyanobacterium RU_4_10]|nr:hypothetical protein [Acaryochloridaceae cyanobacterium RU_4_10]